MPRIRFRNLVIAFLGVCSTAAMALGAEPTASLKKGTPDLKSAGALAFGPEGILFVGDTKGAALFAIDTGDRAPAAEKHAVASQGPGRKSRRHARDRSQADRDQRLGGQSVVGKRLPLRCARTRARRDPGAGPSPCRRQAGRGVARECPLRQGRAPQCSPEPTSEPGPSRSPTWLSPTAGSSSPGFPMKNSPRG